MKLKELNQIIEDDYGIKVKDLSTKDYLALLNEVSN